MYGFFCSIRLAGEWLTLSEYVNTPHLGYSDMVTGSNKQNSIQMAPRVFLHFWDVLNVEERQRFTTSKQFIVLEWVVLKWDSQAKGEETYSPAK